MIGSRRVRVVVQARTSSTRLPGKVLLPLAGRPLVVLCAQRLAHTGHKVIVATSQAPSDDQLAGLLAQSGVPVVRGSLDDVLARLLVAVEDLDDDDVLVRATADNPIPDGAFVSDMVEFLTREGADHARTSSPVDGLPYGLSLEVMLVGALRLAGRAAQAGPDREHVTPWIVRNCRTIRADRSLWGFGDLSALRCTINTHDDYERAQAVFAPHVADPVRPVWRELVDAFAALPDAPRFRIPFQVRSGSVEGVLSLGTAQLGLSYGINNVHGLPSSEAATAIVRRAVEHGVTWLDTAQAYGDSELRVGQALQGSWRDRTRVVTKLSTLPGLNAGVSKACVEGLVDASVYRSLHLFDTHCLDILMLHRWQHHDSHGGVIWRRLLWHRAEGRVRSLGASFYRPEDVLSALRDPDIEHLQIPFNLLDHRWLDPVLVEAVGARPDVRIHVRSVFLQGLLLGDGSNWPVFDPEGPARLRVIDGLVEEFGRSGRADLCISFVLGHPWVASVVLGVETLAQLEENLALVCEKPLIPEQAALARRCLAGAPARLLDPSHWQIG